MRKKFCWSLHYNGANSYLFVNGTEICKFKAKDSEILVGPICLENISKDWSVDNMKSTGFNGYVYDFSVDYDDVVVEDIKDIHKYLMKNNSIVWYVHTCLKDTSRKETYENVCIYQENIFSGVSAFIKFSKHSAVKLYFNK